MQPNNPLPMQSFMSKFTIDMKPVEDALQRPKKSQVQPGADVMEESSSDFQNAEHSIPSQNTNRNDTMVTGNPQAYWRNGSLMQDSTYNFQNEQSVTKHAHIPSKEAPTNFYVPTHSGNIASNLGAATSIGISGQSLPAVPAPLDIFNQQGLTGLSTSNICPWQDSDQASLPLEHYHFGGNWTIGQSTLPSTSNLPMEQHHGLGISASVTITGLPAFNIPMDVAIILLNMYRH